MNDYDIEILIKIFVGIILIGNILYIIFRTYENDLFKKKKDLSSKSLNIVKKKLKKANRSTKL